MNNKNKWFRPAISLVLLPGLTATALILSGCSAPAPKPILQGPPSAGQVLLEQRKSRVRVQTSPPNWENWRTSNQDQIREYQLFLDRYRIAGIVPIWQQFFSARSSEKCGYEPYQIPPRYLWEKRIKVLRLLRQLIEKGILTDFAITSTYRDATLNKCANGSSGSKHVLNAAIDVRLEGTDQEIVLQKQQLCKYWIERGKDVGMGLGLYANGQIHLDREGWRTWGPSYTRDSSPCASLLAKAGIATQ